MKVTQHIENANGKPLFSFEILPPLKGQNIQSIFDSIDPLMEFNPPFIDVTYHREEYEFGFSKEDTENLLIDLDFLGIDNVVALRGDALKTETYFHPEKDGNEYATDLVLQISNLNNGIYLDEDLKNSAQTNFCIGVAGYPEKHMEAPSLDSDIHFLKQKIKNGAKYIITQMFFDNKKYFDYVDKCRAAGITVPIIPGLKPIATKKQLNLIPHRFSLELPDDLIMAVVKAKDNDAVKQIGIEWCTQQSKELVAAGIPVLHYYSMGKAENIKAIASSIF